MSSNATLILGGARSGKSTYAQEMAAKSGKKVLFVATAEALDDEMRRRIEAHRKSRPKRWQTLECPAGVAANIRAALKGHDVVVIDCVTLLVSNILMRCLPKGAEEAVDETAAEENVAGEMKELVSLFKESQARFILVSNEVGLGLVPPSKSARVYRDLLGKANQMLAAAADEVYLMVAGIPLRVKGR